MTEPDLLFAATAAPAPDAPPPPLPTLANLRAQHAQAEADLVRRALLAAGWRLPGAARLLGCAVSSLQAVLRAHPALAAERARERGRAPGGRPRRLGGLA